MCTGAHAHSHTHTPSLMMVLGPVSKEAALGPTPWMMWQILSWSSRGLWSVFSLYKIKADTLQWVNAYRILPATSVRLINVLAPIHALSFPTLMVKPEQMDSQGISYAKIVLNRQFQNCRILIHKGLCQQCLHIRIQYVNMYTCKYIVSTFCMKPIHFLFVCLQWSATWLWLPAYTLGLHKVLGLTTYNTYIYMLYILNWYCTFTR